MMWCTTIILPSDICTNCRDNVIITPQHIHTHARRKGRINAKKERMKKKQTPFFQPHLGGGSRWNFAPCVCVYRGWGASFCTWDSHWPGELWGPTFPFQLLLLLLPFTLAFALFPMVFRSPPNSSQRGVMFHDSECSLMRIDLCRI